jgi:exosortase family protein XrtM
MNRLRQLIRDNAWKTRFFFGFIVLFLLLLTAQYFTISYTSPFMVDIMTIRVSSILINVITPGEKTVVQGGAIIGGATVDVMRGCEGVEGMLIVIAAVCAFTARIRSKIYGIIGGILIVYVFNLLRIIGLYYINRYRPDLFDMMHIYVGQTVIIIISLIYFIFWVSRIEENPRSNP